MILNFGSSSGNNLAGRCGLSLDTKTLPLEGKQPGNLRLNHFKVAQCCLEDGSRDFPAVKYFVTAVMQVISCLLESLEKEVGCFSH